MTNKEIAETILSQLGGRRFITMTGAKNFVAIENGLQLDLPKTAHYVKNGISRIRIVLTPADLYDMTCFKIRGMDVKTISEHKGLYCDMLESTFEEVTGLYTHL